MKTYNYNYFVQYGGYPDITKGTGSIQASSEEEAIKLAEIDVKSSLDTPETGYHGDYPDVFKKVELQ